MQQSEGQVAVVVKFSRPSQWEKPLLSSTLKGSRLDFGEQL